MSRRPRSRRSLRASDAFPVGWAIAGAAALVAIAVGFGWLYTGALQANPERDADTMCPKTGPTEQVLVLVDVTDPVGTIAQADILNQLNAMADTLPMVDCSSCERSNLAMRGRRLSSPFAIRATVRTWTIGPATLKRRGSAGTRGSTAH